MNTDLSNVLDRLLDPSNTTVGGGSASAYSGAMAAGMISMVARLSRKKPIHFTVEEYDAIAAECDQLSIDLQQGCVADTEAYCMIVDAFKLPKETDQEKAIRSAAVQAAAIQAAKVPCENAKRNARVHQLGAMLKGNSNPACISDLTSALYLSEGGVKDCVLNIQANLGLIKDEPTINALKAEMLDLLLEVICY